MHTHAHTHTFTHTHTHTHRGGRAGDKRHLDLAREASRQSVEQFVRKWVLESHPDIGQMKVMVTFPDEVDQTRNVLPGKAVTP